MDKVLQWLALVAAVVSGVWMNLHSIYQVLLVFIVADVIAGALRAATQKDLNATTAYNGILKKAAVLLLVAVTAYAQRLVPGGTDIPLPETLAGFYLYVEGLSILENLNAMGVPIPQFLKDALSKLGNTKDAPPVVPPAQG